MVVIARTEAHIRASAPLSGRIRFSSMAICACTLVTSSSVVLPFTRDSSPPAAALRARRHAARTLAWLCCRPDVRARHRCAGDALLLGKEGYCVRRRRAWGWFLGTNVW